MTRLMRKSIRSRYILDVQQASLASATVQISPTDRLYVPTVDSIGTTGQIDRDKVLIKDARGRFLDF